MKGSLESRSPHVKQCGLVEWESSVEIKLVVDSCYSRFCLLTAALASLEVVESFVSSLDLFLLQKMFVFTQVVS